MKGVKSHDLRKKTDEELVSELKRLRVTPKNNL